MYGMERRDRDSTGTAVDLSFSQILEAHSWQQQQRRRKQQSGVITGPVGGRSGGRGYGGRPPSHHARSMLENSTLHPLDELEEERDEPYDSGRRPASTHRSGGLPRGVSDGYRQQSDTDGEPTDDEEWAAGDAGVGVGQDVYRFVQPRRLSSWVQDDAVNACFKCHAIFTLLLRKHHCRACGRIFCATCSSQRVVIPGDYESMPVAPSYSAITTNASDLIGNISWYMWSSPTQEQYHGHGHDEDDMGSSQAISPEQRQEKFLKDVQRLQQSNVISKFTPCRTRSGSTPSAASTSSSKSAYVPDGSVLQRVCDDCASALQQRRQHYNIVKVFELCEFNLKELRTLGQVCRKWHRASIMCLSSFRQIQYYLPTHRLSEREKALLIINREFLCGHTKWIMQLIKAIDFSSENEDEDPDPAKTHNRALIRDVLALMQRPRRYKCMLTMCSRLCQPELKSVDALEILSDENIGNVRLRAMSVDALLKTATEKEWGSFLPVLLHSLSAEPNAAESKLGQALIRQAQCDVRFCYDFYWGLTVMAEDASCRRKFDGIKQRLLLNLAQLKHNASSGRVVDSSNALHDDIAEQLLRGQEFVDLMWKVPPRVPVKEVRQHFQQSVERSRLFAPSGSSGSAGDSSSANGSLLRLPVDPTVKVGGVNYKTIEVKRSAEAPMVLTCTGVERDEEDVDEDSAVRSLSVSTGEHSSSPPRPERRNSQRLPYYRIMYKRDDLRKDAIVQNIINVMYLILKQETRLVIPLMTYRVLPTSSFDGLIEIVENAHTLYSIIRDHGSILNFLHHYNGHRTLSEISTSFRESLAAYTVITFLLGVGDRHADNVMLTKDGILFHIDYGFILGKDPKPLQPPMRLDHYMIEALGGTQTAQFEQFKKLCVIAFNCLRRHVSLFMIMLTLVVKALPEITDFDMNYTQSDLEAFVIERFLPGQTDDEAATALMLRMEGKLNEKIGLKLSDFVHAHANEKTVSKSIGSVGSSVKVGVEAVSTVASSITSSASSLYNYMWGSNGST
ncbi:hypothetical protein Poli38472_005183 [Pythium oligandrum]|uniref:Phosphatidylinositol 3-kinase n=1 Tax=Pythium oligandrum TaxID=41045 RepID=A0A8K1FGB0_PYTOL|nr:hypothetical protein Poli38472_005183 [Pythium oligandrum]|eukprot:TMW62565.1 hypothetical protein Poli38472_005183 [Pythium oligandrum]